MYIQVIICFAAAPLFLFFIEETRHSVLLNRQVEREDTRRHSQTPSRLASWSTWKVTLIRPLHMFFTEPVVFCLTLWSAFSLGTVFIFTQSIGQVYGEAYQWSESSQGLVMSAVAIGQFAGYLLEPFQDRLYLQSGRRNTEAPGTPLPEARLYLTIPGGLSVAAGFFVYAWTAYDTIHWIAPTISLAVVGFGSYTVVLAVALYLTDAYAKYAASVLAAVVLGESMTASFLPLSTQSMYINLGRHWASTLLGFIALLLSCIPFVLFVYGRRIRERSPFMVVAGY